MAPFTPLYLALRIQHSSTRYNDTKLNGSEHNNTQHDDT
jgi:hypothetical protein